MAVVNAILGWKNEGDRKQDRGWAGHGPEDRPGPQPQASLFSEIFFSLSFPSSSKLQKSLLKSNSGLSRSVGNRGRSQKNGTGEREWCPCPLRPDGGRRRCRVSRAPYPAGRQPRGCHRQNLHGVLTGERARTLSAPEVVPRARLENTWRTDAWQGPGRGRE